MHELSIAMAMIEQVEEILRKEGAVGAGKIVALVGELSGIECEALEFAFSVAREGTMAADAELAIEAVKAAVLCGACGKESNPEVPGMECRHCGSSNVRIVQGRDLVIKKIEAKMPD